MDTQPHHMMVGNSKASCKQCHRCIVRWLNAMSIARRSQYFLSNYSVNINLQFSIFLNKQKLMIIYLWSHILYTDVLYGLNCHVTLTQGPSLWTVMWYTYLEAVCNSLVTVAIWSFSPGLVGSLSPSSSSGEPKSRWGRSEKENCSSVLPGVPTLLSSLPFW